MSWADARAKLKTLLDGTTAQATGYEIETLHAYEFPPPGEISTEMMPCAFIWPPRRTVDHPPMMRHLSIQGCRVEVVLGGPDNLESHARRMDAWYEALAAKYDSSLSLGGDVSNMVSWEFSELRASQAYENVWGFEIAIDIELYEAKANAS